MTPASAPIGSDLDVTCEQIGEHLVLQVSGELDMGTAPVLERQLERAWASDPPELVLDLEGLTFIDSTGVKLILDAHQRATAEEKQFRVRRLPKQARRILQIMGLLDWVPVDD